MPSEQPPSPVSVGITWAYRVTALGLEFSLPALGGYLLDRRWGSAPAATLVGAGLGFAMGLFHLIQLASPGRPTDRTD